jgi:hypothetical protein
VDNSKWERYAALGGVVFVLLDVVVAVLGGEPPATDAPRREVAGYFADKGPAIEAGLWLFGLASVALTWWFGSLWRRMVRSEGGAARLAVVSLVGLALAGALALASASVSAATALRIDEAGDALLVFHTLSAVLLAASGFGVATHLLATSILGARTGTLAAWVVAVGVVAALGFLVSAVLGATTSGDTSSAVGLVGFALWCVWILGVSHRMWSDLRVPASATVDAPAAAPAA